jgi:Tfp pilus assembly protein PilO
MSQADRQADTDAQRGYELSDLKPGAIALFGVGLVIAVLLAVIVTTLFLGYRTVQRGRQDTPAPHLAREREVIVQPRLQVDAAEELRQLRSAEDAVLSSYSWVDKDAGIVKIPIDRAMEILAEKGLPARQREQKKP